MKEILILYQNEDVFFAKKKMGEGGFSGVILKNVFVIFLNYKSFTIYLLSRLQTHSCLSRTSRISVVVVVI